jgi:hypothetical protein
MTDEPSPRRARTAIYNHERAEAIEWRARLEGEATVIEGVLTVVAGSTQVSGQGRLMAC